MFVKAPNESANAESPTTKAAPGVSVIDSQPPSVMSSKSVTPAITTAGIPALACTSLDAMDVPSSYTAVTKY